LIPALLASLAVVDAAFAGFRAAAGRNARIYKLAYYRAAVARGALCGAALVGLLAALTAAVLVSSPNAAQQYADLVRVGGRMLWVLGAYAVLVLAALVVYRCADWNLRSLATVAILGPFTLLRAWVIALACVVGLSGGASLKTAGLTAIACGAVVLLGRGLDRWYGRARLC